MRPNRQHRRRYGKSDEADAIGAARAVLAGEAVGTPKAGTGQVEAIRILRIARRSAMKARTQAGNQIHAVIDTCPEQLRRRFTGRSTDDIVAETAMFRRRHAPTTPLEAARLTLRTLARRWQYLDDELAAVDAQLDELTAATAPTLRAINGVGTQVATAVLAAAGDNPDRLRSSASFAALCGVSPIDASSGRQQHHRLNRYGDRHANWALHVIIISRLRWHPPTQAHMARRLAEGRTPKMVIRCLKRHVVREVYRAITTDLRIQQTSSSSHPQSLLDIQRSFGSRCADWQLRSPHGHPPTEQCIGCSLIAGDVYMAAQATPLSCETGDQALSLDASGRRGTLGRRWQLARRCRRRVGHRRDDDGVGPDGPQLRASQGPSVVE
jgi:transposase